MNRRYFIARTTTLAAATALAPHALRAACTALPAGVQLFTVRDALQRDLRSTLAKLHEIGDKLAATIAARACCRIAPPLDPLARVCLSVLIA